MGWLFSSTGGGRIVEVWLLLIQNFSPFPCRFITTICTSLSELLQFLRPLRILSWERSSFLLALNALTSNRLRYQTSSDLQSQSPLNIFSILQISWSSLVLLFSCPTHQFTALTDEKFCYMLQCKENDEWKYFRPSLYGSEMVNSGGNEITGVFQSIVWLCGRDVVEETEACVCVCTRLSLWSLATIKVMIQ